MAGNLLKNSSQRLIDKALKDHYRDASGNLNRRVNQEFTSEAIENARVNIEAHRQYTLHEARRELDNYAEASLTGKMLANAVPEQPKVVVPRVASVPQRTPGHLTLNFFNKQPVSTGNTVEAAKDHRPTTPRKRS